MGKQGVLDSLQEFATVCFLSAGPVLGATIALVWLTGLIAGLIVLLTR